MMCAYIFTVCNDNNNIIFYLIKFNKIEFSWFLLKIKEFWKKIYLFNFSMKMKIEKKKTQFHVYVYWTQKNHSQLF